MNGSFRVVVVDDVPHVAALHGMFVLAHPRCELVGTAITGTEAVSVIREQEPDLVLLDVHLPEQSGLDALREIRADRKLRQPEVIAVTAARDLETIRDARLMGVSHYLVKPFSSADLHQRIDDVLRTRFAARASGTLAQHEIDAVIRPVDQTRLPKGVSAETLQLVAAAIAANPGRSAGELAPVVGLSRVTLRRYLEHLVDRGAARSDLDYSTAGRPASRYWPSGSTSAG